MRNDLEYTLEYPGDMTSWMFEGNPRFDYHLLQFVKRYEIEHSKQMSSIYGLDKEETKELVFI